ncbi:protease complex subunit PrcB family protein [Flavobacterium arcticum]|uniref:Protease complex subunit PrcB family protein n=1 Tax=Flavobacterium arcticum TaxID=1784713 RepID=A0A345HDW9_9FLAO|nr:protease complex subunit PrcB family protein [Flavobacterium arcticum]AXG74779.1 protease complex subunit PrcB family protein [Flavobacterium arcticum]KAF2509721.1 protease complex subunit PrcB family protein [Flavobacterium arcticum]
MKKIITLSLLVIMAVSCKSKKAATVDGGENFTILKESAYGGREIDSHEFITNNKDYTALTTELGIKDAQKVDFDKNNVVAVFMGQKRSGGYSITIEKVVPVAGTGDTATILVKTTKPKAGEVITMALTAPYCLAVIPKTEKIDVQYIKSSFTTSKLRRE